MYLLQFTKHQWNFINSDNLVYFIYETNIHWILLWVKSCVDYSFHKKISSSQLWQIGSGCLEHCVDHVQPQGKGCYNRLIMPDMWWEGEGLCTCYMHTTPSSGAFLLCALIFPQVIYLCKFLFVKTKIKWENHNAGLNTVPGLNMSGYIC